MMDAETTGIEPLLGLTQVKKLVGGGTLEMKCEAVHLALRQRGFDPGNVGETTAETFRTSLSVFERDPVFQTALGSNPLPWEAHIKMVAAVQPFLSGGVSKTINMPADSTVEDVKAAYRMAWELGLKSIAVY